MQAPTYRPAGAAFFCGLRGGYGGCPLWAEKVPGGNLPEDDRTVSAEAGKAALPGPGKIRRNRGEAEKRMNAGHRKPSRRGQSPTDFCAQGEIAVSGTAGLRYEPWEVNLHP